MTLFIFNSNASRYRFEYRTSKLYKIETKEALKISPSVLKAEQYRSLLVYSSDYATDVVSVTLGVSDFSLRDLTVNQATHDAAELSIEVADFSLRDLVVSNTVGDTVEVAMAVSDANLLNLTISSTVDDVVEVSMAVADFSLN